MLCKDIDMLENIQKYLIRCIFKKFSQSRVTYDERLNALNIISRERRRLITPLITLYHIFYQYISCNILSNFDYLYDNLRGHLKCVCSFS